MSARSARRPVPALVFLLALAVLAVVVWVRVADRDSAANESSGAGCASAPQLPVNGAVTVTVLNGAGRDGLASSTLAAFGAAGFARGNYDNAKATLPGVATVTAGPNGTRGALLVSYYLPGSTVTADARGDNSVTVTLGQKFTTLANAATVKAAMIKAMVSQSAPAPKVTSGAPVTKAPTSGAKSTGSPSPTATCTTTPPVPTPAGAAPATPAS